MTLSGKGRDVQYQGVKLGRAHVKTLEPFAWLRYTASKRPSAIDAFFGESLHDDHEMAADDASRVHKAKREWRISLARSSS